MTIKIVRNNDIQYIENCENVKTKTYNLDELEKEALRNIELSENQGTAEAILQYISKYKTYNKNFIDTNDRDLLDYYRAKALYGDKENFVHNDKLYCVEYSKYNMNFRMLLLKTDSQVYFLNNDGNTIDRI